MATVDLPCYGYGFGSTVAWNRERSITWISLPITTLEPSIKLGFFRRSSHQLIWLFVALMPAVQFALLGCLWCANMVYPKTSEPKSIASEIRIALDAKTIDTKDPYSQSDIPIWKAILIIIVPLVLS